MDGFSHKNGQLYCEGVSVEALTQRYGTPLYIYSRTSVLNRLKELQDAFQSAQPLVCYSVKANSNVAILQLLARKRAGFDIVSCGELFRTLRAGANPSKIVFAGVGKSAEEIRAAIRAGILMFNAESQSELRAIDDEARKARRIVRIALRLNPDVDARTHAKTTTGKKENKFGIDLGTAAAIFANRARYPHLEVSGIHLHLGSPIYSVTPYRNALQKMERFLREIRSFGANIKTLNVGGGYCISYDGKPVIRAADYAAVILPAVKKMGLGLILEPGRFIVGNSAILVSTVIYIKDGWNSQRFVVLDAGMNDLLRPAFYGSYHHIWPVKGDISPLLKKGRGKRGHALEKVDIVGPICETSDCFAMDRIIPPVREGALMAIFSAGAYGMVMSSNYNSRPRPCEVLVSGARAKVIRKRETYEDLTHGE